MAAAIYLLLIHAQLEQASRPTTENLIRQTLHRGAAVADFFGRKKSVTESEFEIAERKKSNNLHLIPLLCQYVMQGQCVRTRKATWSCNGYRDSNVFFTNCHEKEQFFKANQNNSQTDSLMTRY